MSTAAAQNTSQRSRMFERFSSSTLVGRMFMAAMAGMTFKGKRNVHEQLGYLEKISPADYRYRYERNEIAARVVEALPVSTWRTGGELVETDDPEEVTEFEQAWFDLESRLNIWSKFLRTDVMAGLGRYAVLLIGAPGDLKSELPKLKGPDEVWYLSLYPEEHAKISKWQTEATKPRYGMPLEYSLSRPTDAEGRIGLAAIEAHHTRVLHVSDGLLDDDIYGKPRLQRIWNRIDDLEKVVGGGAEALWKRADPGMQLELDPEVEMTPDDERKLSDEVDEYQHGLRRVIRTRGVDLKVLDANVAQIDKSVDSILSLISGGCSIPKRILLGSEAGELASTQDRDNWNDRISDRRFNYAEPMIVRPFVDLLIRIGALPAPNQETGYTVRWPQLEELNEVERADVALKQAQANKAQGERILTSNEIRDRVYGYDPLDDVEMEAPAQEMPRAAKSVGSAWRRVRKAAARNETRVSRAVRQAFAKAQASVNVEKLERALASGDHPHAERMLVQAVAEATSQLDETLPGLILQTLTDGGQAGEGRL